MKIVHRDLCRSLWTWVR